MHLPVAGERRPGASIELLAARGTLETRKAAESALCHQMIGTACRAGWHRKVLVGMNSLKVFEQFRGKRHILIGDLLINHRRCLIPNRSETPSQSSVALIVE